MNHIKHSSFYSHKLSSFSAVKEIKELEEESDSCIGRGVVTTEEGDFCSRTGVEFLEARVHGDFGMLVLFIGLTPATD